MEKVCFELENVVVTYLDKELLNIEKLAVHQFDRIGIVGKNGAGKSTLMKLLAGKQQPVSGKLKRHVHFGYFEQMEAPTLIEADPQLLGKLAVPKYSEGLSGGEQTRLKLAQLFTSYEEALLIDEPTTHLDQLGISFLLDELRYYYGALVLISHDRAVLDELVTTIWEVDGGKVTIYSGNYSDYVMQKQLEQDQQNQAHDQYLKEKNRLEKAVDEKMKKAEKIAQAGNMSKREANAKPNRMFMTKSKGTSQKAVQRAAKAIEHRIGKLQKVEAVQEERKIVFRQSKALALHNKYPIMADRFTLYAQDKVLLHEVSFQIPLSKKIALTGNNGSGKSTLLKHIANNGEGITISPKAKIGYFHQMGYQFADEETVLQFLKNRSEYDESLLRSVLHSMQFAGTDLQKKITTLSGGEAIRLQLCQLFLGNYNILLLDEPTNFLDIQALEALEQFIAAYEGTIIFVTHDKNFIDNVADIQFTVHNKKIF
ncbi:ABC-F type ribosomal protection protein [Lysinibacillus sp. HST-98]|uniref:Msr family ABC-F type ribosomal protection protein n=1 Tax=Lysinibacillus TaxID=400634 RepID=UPI0001DA5B10|nr:MULTISPECIES: ABC-F type ribosomal protection protein [Lysinibacillus]EFI66850.1 erythromycin resistance ATP-binding protein [Lysinibacillus fusiformis ZC1]EKU44085.1 erythromycin resistance ATP-binding protein [Lysinibacillus fusiformis ZB2]MBL3730977.1 ABC-F type ribosomal protection protein [Lysinibacillus sp. HST-98]MBU5254313.1 ABC-F type ribosomal protection protein [Lysinibacillus capsici]MED4701334.1 ABC-F type ribosomal protection protein [Lysinibacillus capsici]